MTLSSDTLFHFTRTPEYLVSILKNNFKPFYSLEEVNTKTKSMEYAIPMVCFCDIPLSQIKNHLNIYGEYGLGLKKDWGIKNGLNPVLYLEKNSMLGDYIVNISKEIWHKDLKSVYDNKKLASNYFHFLRYVKMYQGDFKRKDKIHKEYRYYNEREWRYVPEVKDLSNDGSDKFVLSKDEYNSGIIRATMNQKLHDCCQLFFEPKDIEYVIVKTKTEIFPMLDALEIIKGRFDERDRKMLLTKIITIDQITRDF